MTSWRGASEGRWAESWVGWHAASPQHGHINITYVSSLFSVFNYCNTTFTFFVKPQPQTSHLPVWHSGLWGGEGFSKYGRAIRENIRVIMIKALFICIKLWKDKQWNTGLFLEVPKHIITHHPHKLLTSFWPCTLNLSLELKDFLGCLWFSCHLWPKSPQQAVSSRCCNNEVLTSGGGVWFTSLWTN